MLKVVLTSQFHDMAVHLEAKLWRPLAAIVTRVDSAHESSKEVSRGHDK